LTFPRRTPEVLVKKENERVEMVTPEIMATWAKKEREMCQSRGPYECTLHSLCSQAYTHFFGPVFGRHKNHSKILDLILPPNPKI